MEDPRRAIFEKMSDQTVAHEIIEKLQSSGYSAECPCCAKRIALSQCGLFYLNEFTETARELYEQYWRDLRERRAELRQRRKRIFESSTTQTRATNIGAILERLAPSLGGFQFECSDCRSLFDPIDYIIFEGLCRSGRVSRIVFADIKTGRSRLSFRQREIRGLVQGKRVEFDVYGERQ